jgi:hypothetical protein
MMQLICRTMSKVEKDGSARDHGQWTHKTGSLLGSLARPSQQYVAGAGFGFDFEFVRTGHGVLRIRILRGIARKLVAVIRRAVEDESSVSA